MEEKLRRKQELEIKTLKVELRKVCLTNFEFKKYLSELKKENHVLKGQLQKSHEDDQNSKGQMQDNILYLNKQVEEVKKIEADLTRQLQEMIEVFPKKELNILSLKEDLDKTTTQFNTNPKTKNNIEENKSSMEKEENANNNTCILRISHDQQESREVASHRYPIRFHAHYYKCNNYGHKAIHCRAHDIITPERNKRTFFSVLQFLSLWSFRKTLLDAGTS